MATVCKRHLFFDDQWAFCHAMNKSQLLCAEEWRQRGLGKPECAKFQTSFYADPVDAVFKALGVQ